MKRIKRKIIIAIISTLPAAYCLLPTSSQAQDAHFSQYYASPVYLNPALTGLESNITFSSNFRTQWSSIIVPYNTTQMSIIYPLKSKSKGYFHYGGAGISFYNDKAGDAIFKTTGVSLSGAYNLLLSNTGFQKVTFGMKVGFIQKKLDNKSENLKWGAEYDPFDPVDGYTDNSTFSEDVGKVTFPDISAGVFWHYNAVKNYSYSSVSAFSGLSLEHINNPEQSFIDTTIVSKLPLLYKYHGGLEINMKEKISVSPNLLVMYQNQIYQINVGMYLSYRLEEGNKGNKGNRGESRAGKSPLDLGVNEIIFGTWYRYRDAFIFLIGINNPWFTVGLSYDLNSSSLKTNTQGTGAYEISLSMRLVKEKEIKHYSTPRF